MIRLTMEEVDEDGTHVFPETWTTGPCVRTALRLWKREHPALAEYLVKTEVVSAPRHRVRHTHVGRPVGHANKIRITNHEN
jgi:hypothetical protein